MKHIFLTLFAISLSLSSYAAVKSKNVEYRQGDSVFEGFVASPAKAGKYPGIIVVHDWMGITESTKARARQLAELGYVAFAADIYGRGVRPSSSEEASKLATQHKNDRPGLRTRARAAFEELARQPNVNINKIAAIGYCFGGTTALELARSGTPLVAVVSFHGGLSTPSPADAKNIKGKVLALHGADDPYVPDAEVLAFQKEMRDAKVDWQLHAYGGAVHAFTVKEAGSDPSKGQAYNPQADKRSWEQMKDFFKEVF